MQELSFWISKLLLFEMGYLLEEIDTSVNSWSIDGFQGETELNSETGASQKSAFRWQWFSGEAYSVWSLCHVYVNLQPQTWELQQARGSWKKTWVNEYSLVLRAKKEKVILGLFILDMKRWKGNIITSKYMKDCCKRSSFFSLFTFQVGQDKICLNGRKNQVRH